jgi:hypothetical protein
VSSRFLETRTIALNSSQEKKIDTPPMLLIKRKKDSLPFNIRTHSEMRFESGEINGHFQQWGVRRGEVGRRMAIDTVIDILGKKRKKIQAERSCDHVKRIIEHKIT